MEGKAKYIIQWMRRFSQLVVYFLQVSGAISYLWGHEGPGKFAARSSAWLSFGSWGSGVQLGSLPVSWWAWDGLWRRSSNTCTAESPLLLQVRWFPQPQLEGAAALGAAARGWGRRRNPLWGSCCQGANRRPEFEGNPSRRCADPCFWDSPGLFYPQCPSGPEAWVEGEELRCIRPQELGSGQPRLGEQKKSLGHLSWLQASGRIHTPIRFHVHAHLLN